MLPRGILAALVDRDRFLELGYHASYFLLLLHDQVAEVRPFTTLVQEGCEHSSDATQLLHYQVLRATALFTQLYKVEIEQRFWARKLDKIDVGDLPFEHDLSEDLAMLTSKRKRRGAEGGQDDCFKFLF